MSVEVNTILYVGVESIFEALAWGLSGYVALRLLGIPRKYWYMEIPLITLVFVAWQYWTNSYLSPSTYQSATKTFCALSVPTRLASSG